jgi:hypothetical protein
MHPVACVTMNRNNEPSLTVVREGSLFLFIHFHTIVSSIHLGLSRNSFPSSFPITIYHKLLIAKPVLSEWISKTSQLSPLHRLVEVCYVACAIYISKIYYLQILHICLRQIQP